MSLGFDGLRTILGNSAVAVPEVEAAAIEQPVVSVTPVEMPPASDRDLDPPSGSHEFSDIPGLADLDRGVYRPSNRNPHDDPSAALEALDRGLADSTPRRARAASPNASRPSDQESLDIDGGLIASVASRGARTPAPSSSNRPLTTVVVEREVSGWAAVAIMTFGLVLGATAAAAIFHDDVSHLVASWERGR